MPPDTHTQDYAQKLLGIDLEYSIGHLILFGEAYVTEWEAPVINGDLRAFSYYVEAKYKILPGLYAAARWNQILFNAIPTPTGSKTWDRDTTRIEVGVGYYAYQNLLIKAEYEFNIQRGPTDPKDDVGSLSVTLSW
jgi:predicted porin